MILAAINSFASLPQVFPIAPRDILGINWSLLLSCLLGFRICMFMHSTSADDLSFFFFFKNSFRWKIELGGQIGGLEEEILAFNSSPAFPDTIQTHYTKNVC